MTEHRKFQLLCCWCLLLTMWGGYFTYQFVQHEKWQYRVYQEILKNQKEIKHFIENGR